MFVKNRFKLAQIVLLVSSCSTFVNLFCPAPTPSVPAGSSPARDLGVVSGDGGCKFRTYFTPSNEIALATDKAKLFVGAEINSDFYLARHAETLTDSPTDAIDQFRHRSDLSFLFKYGTNLDPERPSVESKLTIGNTLFMRVTAKPEQYHASNTVVASGFDSNNSPIKTQFQEAWIKVNFDRIAPEMDKRPHYLKVGYFPFLVGRGISLGDWTLGGVDYMGFKKNGLQTYAPTYPAGLLWHGQVSKFASYDLYFSPMVVEDMLGADMPETVAVKLPNASLNSRHIFAISGKIGGEFKNPSDKINIKEGEASVNPYWVYYNSPRNTISRAADAPIELHTVGMMADMSSGGFDINIEVAKQFGRQTVREFIHTDFPSVQHFDPATGAFRALPASVVAKLPAGSTNPTRYFPNDNGTGTDSWQTLDKTERLGEHHPGYEIDLRGWMAVFDLRYSFKDYPAIAALAGGFFSGGQYPYNDNTDNYFGSKNDDYHSTLPGGEVQIKSNNDRIYKGFLPLRDWDYRGLWAHQLVMINAGIVPRPKSIDIFNLSSRNDRDTLTNIVYFGGGLTLKPMADRDKLRVSTNIFGYWIDDRLYKWDKKALPPTRLVESEGTLASGTKLYDQFNIEGWVTDRQASSFVGWEINAIINYKITKNLDLSIRGGIFFPGQLYTDIAGQPNDNTLKDSTEFAQAPGLLKNTIKYEGLGDSKAYGFYTRIRYVF